MERLGRPDIVAVEGDVLPAERRDMSEQIVTDSLTTGAQLSNGVAEVDRIPKDDGRDDEIEARWGQNKSCSKSYAKTERSVN